jgi:eukaryotic-like serine/threonine-protein kinase
MPIVREPPPGGTPSADDVGSADRGVSVVAEGGRTLSRDDLATSAAPTVVSGDVEPELPEGAEPAPDFGTRYEDWGMLGRGGMGEVRACHDRHIGRRIALKVIRRSRAARVRARARFVREAKIQGRLEHPAVVPVYDIGDAPDGRVYFTMKQVFGRTLEEIVAGLRDGDPEITAEYGRRRLLEAFARVCLAVDYIHESGVLHRDIKPANVMLGRYGEVYVLDWGLAKLLEAEDDEGEPAASPESAPTLDGDSPAEIGQTAAGELMGTPGYMAPEQLDGGLRPVGVAADIYALGAVLFELLTWQPLHPRGSVQRLIGSTIHGADARCSERAPHRQVPPELEAICVRATADDPAERFASSRALHDAVEAYLDGERDLALRGRIAQTWAARAAATAASVLEGHDDDPGRRGRALEEASRALALDPDNADARTTIVRLLLEPPSVPPPEAEEMLLEAQREEERIAARGGVIGFSAWLMFIPGILALGVRDWWMTGLLFAVAVAALVVSWIGGRSRRPEHVTRPGAFALGMIGLVLVGRLFGPLVLVPGLAATTAASFCMQVTGVRRLGYLAAAAAVVVVPLALELLGILPPSYRFEGGHVILDPHLTSLPQTATLVFLVTATVAAIVVPPLLLSRTRDSLRRAERDLSIHTWQMEQLLPADARSAFDENTGTVRRGRRSRD